MEIFENYKKWNTYIILNTAYIIKTKILYN